MFLAGLCLQLKRQKAQSEVIIWFCISKCSVCVCVFSLLVVLLLSIHKGIYTSMEETKF